MANLHRPISSSGERHDVFSGRPRTTHPAHRCHSPLARYSVEHRHPPRHAYRRSLAFRSSWQDDQSIPSRAFLLPGIVVPLLERKDDEQIGPDDFAEQLAALPTGGAVLIHTGWDQYWKTERYLRHPYLSREAAQLLADKGASIVGIDALNLRFHGARDRSRPCRIAGKRCFDR